MGTTPDGLSDDRSDVKVIREFLLTPSLAIPDNSIARWANFVAQSHHAHHSAAAEVTHTSLYTSASLAAVDSALTRAPTVEKLKAYALVEHLKTELQAQKAAIGQAIDKRQQQQRSQQPCLSATAAKLS